MARAKGRTITRKRHKRVPKLTKGYYGSKHTLSKTAKEQVTNPYGHTYRDRRQKKRDFHELWIAHINTIACMNGLGYSKLMYGLKVVEVDTNRKMPAGLTVNDAVAFTALAGQAKDASAK